MVSDVLLMTQGLVWSGDILSMYAGHRDVETAVEIVTVVVNSEPPISPWSSLTSPWSSSVSPWPQSVADPRQRSSTDTCAHFRRVAALRRRTHPFYVAATSGRTTRSPDVTLATQLTVDRLQVLERVLVNWPGPASVTLHVRDADLQAAMDVIQSSATIRRRTNVDIHVVYRRLVHPASSLHSFRRQRLKSKGKGFPYSIPSVGPGADPGVQAVSPQVSHPPGGRLPLLSARPAGYLPSRRASPPFGRYQVINCLLTEAHRCEQLAQGCLLRIAWPRVGFGPATY